MTCCRPIRRKRGFATLAAAVLCLALGLMATAMVEAATLDLRASLQDQQRLGAQYALDGAHRLAADAIIAQGAAGRMQFTVQADGGPFEVVAEPEAPKVAASQAARLDARQWAALQVSQPLALVRRLAALAAPSADDPTVLDPSPVWQACGPSLISIFGLAQSPAQLPAHMAPSGRFSWRAGEVWRLRLTNPDGWTDERWIRFTGDRLKPAAIILRTFRRSQPIGSRCDTLLK